MKRKQYGVIVVLALVAGFIGGIVSNQIPVIQSAFAQKSGEPKKVIEANEFRLIDKYGNHIASLKGEDDPHISARQKPVLEMNDPIWNSKLTSGSLLISRGKEEQYSSLDPNSLMLVDGDNWVFLASSYVGGEGPSLRISDSYKMGRWRAILGNVDLETKKSGTVTRRSAASLVLFDKQGNVIWSTPQ